MYFSPDEVSSFNAETSYWSPGPKRSNFSHLVSASCFHFSKAYLKIHSVESIFYSIKLQQNINLNYPKKVPAKVFQQNFLENGSMSLEIIKDSTKKKKKEEERNHYNLPKAIGLYQKIQLLQIKISKPTKSSSRIHLNFTNHHVADSN